MKKDLFIFINLTFFTFKYEVRSLNNPYLIIVLFIYAMSAVRKDMRSCSSVRRDRCHFKLDNAKEGNTNSINSRKMAIGIAKRQIPLSRNVSDSTRTSCKLNSSLVSTVHSLPETENITFEKVDIVEAKVGSLNASPKWSRIKNKFENASQKTKLTRSSSMPRDSAEILPVKSLTSKPISKSLTRLNQENNLSCCERVNPSHTALSLNIENEQVAVDSLQLSFLNIECKNENSGVLTRDSANVDISKQHPSNERSTALKVPLCESTKSSQGCSSSKGSVPCSANFVARSLLPSSKFASCNKMKLLINSGTALSSVHKSATFEHKPNDVSKWHSNSNENIGNKANEKLSNSKNCVKSFTSITSSSFPSSTNKNSQNHDANSPKVYSEKPLQSYELCDKNSRHEVFTASVHKDNASSVTAKNDSNLGKNSSLLSMKGSLVLRATSEVVQSSNTGPSIRRYRNEVPNLLWTQTDSGSWAKILCEKPKVGEKNESKESKVALLTSKFNALTIQDGSESIPNNTNEVKGLSKSLTTSSVPGTIYCKGDKNQKTFILAPERILTKSSTIGNMFSQSLPHKTPNIQLSGKVLGSRSVNSSENKKTDSEINVSSKLFNKKQNLINTNRNPEDKLSESVSVEELDSVKSSRKLSVVQRAVLSYEESLSLLSPESQRKFLKASGNSKLEAENERLFSDMKESYSVPQLSYLKKKDTMYSMTESDQCLTSQKLGILKRLEENGISAVNLKISSLDDSLIKSESTQSNRIIPGAEEGSLYSNITTVSNDEKSILFPSTLNAECLEEPTCCSLYCNLLIKQSKEPEKAKLFVPHIVSKTPVPLPRRQMLSKEQPLYANGCDKSVVYTSTTLNDDMFKEKKISLQPNSSFLWRNSQTQSKEELTTCENDDLYFDFENYYSSVQFQTVQDTPKLDQIATSDSLQLTSKPDNQFSTQKNSDGKDNGKTNQDGHNESENEDWMDVSDAETNVFRGNTPQSPTGTLKIRAKLKKSICHKGLRRSWSQSLRDLAKVTSNSKNEDESKDDWYSDDYNDVCVWEMVDGTDNSSGSTDTDHYYEPVYESLNKYLVDDEEDDSDESYSISHSPDEAVKDFGSSSNTSLEFAGKDKPELPPSNRPVSVSDNESSLGLGKKAGEKIRQLKRNWSLTKSDFRLELTSKLNKIKIRKNMCNSAEIGVSVHEGSSSLACPKKKTLIKCILKQKNSADSADGCLSSTKKDSPTFYVQLSVANEKHPYTHTKEMTSNEKQNNVELSAKVRKASEPSVLLVKTYDDEKLSVGRGRRGSLKNNIQRPKTPPPLPPIYSARLSQTETKALPILRETSTSQMLVSKGLSLDSSFHSVYSGLMDNNACEKLKSSEMKKSFSTLDTGPFPPIDVTKTVTSQRIQGSSASVSDSTSAISRTRSSIASSGSSIESYHLADEGDQVYTASPPSSISLTPPISEGNIFLKNERCKEKCLHEISVHNGDAQVEALKSPFEEEPLYQFYQRDVLQRATLWYTDSSESDIEDDYFYCNTNAEQSESKQTSLKSQMSAMDLVHGEMGGQRTLWCEVPEVVTSGVLNTIITQDRKLQEAMFEVITSEASYLKSLNILVGHFLQCSEFADEFSTKCVLNRREKHILFSDILPVREVTIQLLADLEKRWLENIIISNVCDIIYEHSSKNFSVYVKYCSNQVYKDRMLKELKETKPDFVEVLRRLESSSVCQGLDMHSFLMLPMQRITRLPLLIDAIFHRLSLDSPIYESCKMALATLNKIVAECNEGARRMERMEEMLRISHQLDFKGCKSVGLISSSRWLVKKGELIRLRLDTGYKRTFGRSTRWNKANVYFFLFTDLLVITKKKSEENYSVLDYCPRNMMQVLSIDNEDSGGFQLPIRPPPQYKNLFQLIMLNNHEGKTVEIILSCTLESDRTRWMEAVTPPASENPDERIYEEWDCPQVQCIHTYIAQQPDELGLEQSDVVNVFRKIADGWYEGERIRDGVRGWFPASHTVEIISSHVRARNLRQRYRLLMLSQTWLEEQHKAHLVSQGKG